MDLPGFSLLCERVASLETDNKNQTKKINEMHKALLGNGQPGILAEWNQWKGSMKFFKATIAVSLTIISIAIALLAYLK